MSLRDPLTKGSGAGEPVGGVTGQRLMGTQVLASFPFWVLQSPILSLAWALGAQGRNLASLPSSGAQGWEEGLWREGGWV